MRASGYRVNSEIGTRAGSLDVSGICYVRGLLEKFYVSGMIYDGVKCNFLIAVLNFKPRMRNS